MACFIQTISGKQVSEPGQSGDIYTCGKNVALQARLPKLNKQQINLRSLE